MNTEQAMVEAFHLKFGATAGKTPALRDNELRAKLLMEEAVETVAALGFSVWANIEKPGLPGEADHRQIAYFKKSYDKPDFDDTIDGLCDLLYVVYGAAVTFGIDLFPFFSEVHRSNMAKTGGGNREDGKVLKPDGWTPPKIKEIREAQEHLARVWAELKVSPWEEAITIHV